MVPLQVIEQVVDEVLGGLVAHVFVLLAIRFQLGGGKTSAGFCVFIELDKQEARELVEDPVVALVLDIPDVLPAALHELHEAGEAVFRMECFLRPLLQALYYVWFEFAHHIFGIANIVPVLHLVMDLIPLFDEIDAQMACHLDDAIGCRTIGHKNAEGFVPVGLGFTQRCRAFMLEGGIAIADAG